MASLPLSSLHPQLSKLSPATVEKRNDYMTTRDKCFEQVNLEFGESHQLTAEADISSAKLESSHYVPLIQECIDNNTLSGVRCIHGQITKTGFSHDLFLNTCLVNAYGKCRNMETARKVFDNMPTRNVVTWTSLMSGYILHSRPELALTVFIEMLEAGGYPTNYTLGIVINACTSLCDIELGKQIHGYICKYGIEHDANIGNVLCSLYAKCRNLSMAIKAFNRIEERDVISWTAAISASGDNGNSSMGLNLFVEMIDEGIKPNEITLTSVLSLCCTTQIINLGLQVHSFCVKLGYGSDLRVKNSLMYLYLKNGYIDEAKKLFDELNNRSLVTWNAMIAGHVEMSNNLTEDGLVAYSSGIEALKIFQRMNKSGLKPDLYTFSSVLTVCSGLVALEQGEQLHAQCIKTGFLSDVVVGTALLNMYSKCGSVEGACKAFIEMPTRTLISWTSMIAALAQHGRSQEALELFEDMRFIGDRPNKITFVGVLSACSQAGLVDQALRYYEMMKTEYKINPVMDHYACLIDMFVRLGQIDEAFEFIKNMNVVPNEVIWSILIAGCRSQGKLELAYYAAEQLLELKPRDSETYHLLLNMYISAEKWKEVSRVRKMMKEEKIDSKITDVSWISVKDKVYTFKLGDKKHHQYKEVLQYLDDLINRAGSHGYCVEMSNLETGSDEETEEAHTDLPIHHHLHHSEKLAVAFGLLNTPKQSQIRVFKSISMCRDCHSFIKAVSMLTSRTIVVRDSKRLHKFSDGLCSCGDFGSLVG